MQGSIKGHATKLTHFYDMQFPKCFRYLRHILFGIRNFRLLSFRSHNVQILQPEQVDARSLRRRLNRKISIENFNRNYLQSKIAILLFVSATSRLQYFANLNPSCQRSMWVKIRTPGENRRVFGRVFT